MLVGTVHPMEGDGVSAALFDHLAKENKGLSSARVWIPSTVLFEQGFAKAWYFSERVTKPGENGGKRRFVEVKKRTGKDCDLEVIKQVMLKDAAEGEICAVFLSISGRDVSEKGRATYFTPSTLKAFLRSQMQKPKGLLQKFVKPRSLNNNVIVCTWSPNFMVTELIRNRHSLCDKYVDPATRAVTFEADSMECTVSSVSSSVRRLLQEQCMSIVSHFLSTDHLQIARMMLYFKVDCSSNLRLLFSSSIRIIEPKNTSRDVSSPVNLSVKLLSGRPDDAAQGRIGPVKDHAYKATGYGSDELCTVLTEGEKRSRHLLASAVFADALPVTDSNSGKASPTRLTRSKIKSAAVLALLQCARDAQRVDKAHSTNEALFTIMASATRAAKPAPPVPPIAAVVAAAKQHASTAPAALDVPKEHSTAKRGSSAIHRVAPERKPSRVPSAAAGQRQEPDPQAAPAIGRNTLPATAEAEDEGARQRQRIAWKQWGAEAKAGTAGTASPASAKQQQPPLPQQQHAQLGGSPTQPTPQHTPAPLLSERGAAASPSPGAGAEGMVVALPLSQVDSPPAPHPSKQYAFAYRVGKSNYVHCGANEAGGLAEGKAAQGLLPGRGAALGAVGQKKAGAAAPPQPSSPRAAEEAKIRAESIKKKRVFLRQLRAETLPDQGVQCVADESIFLTNPRFSQMQPRPVSPYRGGDLGGGGCALSPLGVAAHPADNLVPLVGSPAYSQSYTVNIANSRFNKKDLDEYASSNYRFFNSSVVDVVLPSMIPPSLQRAGGVGGGGGAGGNVTAASPSAAFPRGDSPQQQQGYGEGTPPLGARGYPPQAHRQQQQQHHHHHRHHRPLAQRGGVVGAAGGSVLVRAPDPFPSRSRHPSGHGGLPLTPHGVPQRVHSSKALGGGARLGNPPVGQALPMPRAKDAPPSPRAGGGGVAEGITRRDGAPPAVRSARGAGGAGADAAAPPVPGSDREDDLHFEEEEEEAHNDTSRVGRVPASAPAAPQGAGKECTAPKRQRRQLLAEGGVSPAGGGASIDSPVVAEAFLGGYDEQALLEAHKDMSEAERVAVAQRVSRGIEESRTYLSELCYAVYSHFMGAARQHYYVEPPKDLPFLTWSVLAVVLRRFRPQSVRTAAFCTKDVPRHVADSDNGSDDEAGVDTTLLPWPVGQHRPTSSFTRRKQVKLTMRQLEEKEARQKKRLAAYKEEFESQLRVNRARLLDGYLGSAMCRWPPEEAIDLAWGDAGASEDDDAGDDGGASPGEAKPRQAMFSSAYRSEAVSLVLPLCQSGVLLAKGEGEQLSLLDPFVTEQPAGLLLRAVRCWEIQKQLDLRVPEAPLLPMACVDPEQE